MTHEQALTWAIGRLRELEAISTDSPAEQRRLAETISRLQAQRAQRRQMSDWVAAHLSGLSTKLPPEDAQAFRDLCAERGESVYSALRRLVEADMQRSRRVS